VPTWLSDLAIDGAQLQPRRRALTRNVVELALTLTAGVGLFLPRPYRVEHVFFEVTPGFSLAKAWVRFHSNDRPERRQKMGQSQRVTV
jgi:hypothetical protein